MKKRITKNNYFWVRMVCLFMFTVILATCTGQRQNEELWIGKCPEDVLKQITRSMSFGKEGDSVTFPTDNSIGSWWCSGVEIDVDIDTFFVFVTALNNFIQNKQYDPLRDTIYFRQFKTNKYDTTLILHSLFESPAKDSVIGLGQDSFLLAHDNILIRRIRGSIFIKMGKNHTTSIRRVVIPTQVGDCFGIYTITQAGGDVE